MGMIANLLRVSESELTLFLEDSSILDRRISDLAPGDASAMDVDKSWEGILYLLTGLSLTQLEERSHPLARVLISNQWVDETQDFGYGPATFLDPEEVAGLSEQMPEPQLFIGRYNAGRMNEDHVYPEAWEHPGSREYLLDNYSDLYVFYRKAAEENQAMITYFS